MFFPQQTSATGRLSKTYRKDDVPEITFKSSGEKSLLEKFYFKARQFHFMIILFLVSFVLISLHSSGVNWLGLITSSSSDYFLQNSSQLSNKIIELVMVTPPKTKAIKIHYCHIPRLDPFDSSILELTKDNGTSIHCFGEYPRFFQSTLNSSLVFLGFTQTVWKVKSSTSWGPCYYKIITRGISKDRPDDAYDISDETYPISTNKLMAETQIPKEHEFIAISCKFKNQTIKEGSVKVVDTHAFTPEKPHVEQRVAKYYKNLEKNFTTKERKNILREDERINVVIFGIDTVSHMNFLRVMPITHHFLKNELSAVEMQAYNKIGDNTYPNVGAMMIAENRSVLQSTCGKNKTFDTCNFIWKEYTANGYRTSFGEDAPNISIFNYLTKGFINQPTDYYLRPFAKAADKLTGHGYCYGSRLCFDVLLDYLKKMAVRMGKNKRYLQFVWSTSLTHDKLNNGRRGDVNLVSTLKWFKDQGHLNNTAFILMSDHGIRWGKMHEFKQGKLEVSLPFLYFVLPDWFKEKYPRAFNNLKENQERLSTPFDLHETLGDLLHLGRLEQSQMISREVELIKNSKKKKLPRGISQFLPIPLERTCQTAEIPENYCTCRTLKPIGNDKNAEEESKIAANSIVSYLNELLKPYSQCSKLTLHEIKSANFIEFEDKAKGGNAYQLSVVTKPGEGLFEAAVVKNIEGFWNVTGDVMRTNLYGNQSHCISEKDLKLYCYCDDTDHNKKGGFWSYFFP